MEAQTFKLVTSRIDELFSPADIAKELKITTQEAIEHIFVVIGEGRIRQSDLFFILAKKYSDNKYMLDHFATGESSLEKLRAAMERLDEVGIFGADSDPGELMLYISYRRRRVYLGDMYVFIAELERTLHEKVKSVLIRSYGPDETQWWKNGVNEKIRQKCAAARQLDAKFESHEYSYTTLIDLKEILDEKKSMFFARLPEKVVVNNNNIKTLLSDLTLLNGIRNQVMHPVREGDPTERDFLFIREMHNKLCPSSLWR